MSQSISVTLILGAQHAGLSDLRAQLIDTAGASIGAAVSTGFVVIGNASNGLYGWTGSVADDFQGFVNFYSLSDATIATVIGVNQLEGNGGTLSLTYTLTSSVDGSAIQGATIELYAESGMVTLLDSQTTNILGQCTFSNLVAGTYYLKRIKSGWTFANPDVEVVS